MWLVCLEVSIALLEWYRKREQLLHHAVSHRLSCKAAVTLFITSICSSVHFAMYVFTSNEYASRKSAASAACLRDENEREIELAIFEMTTVL